MSLVALATAVLLGVVSTLTLRAELLDRVDDALVAASDRGKGVPDLGGFTPPDLDPGSQHSPDPSTDPTAGTGSTPYGWDGEPPGLGARGQAAGTVVVEVRDGAVIAAAYLDAKGEPQSLTDAQAKQVMQACEKAGKHPVWVTIEGLGTYRALKVTRDDGSSMMTALPWESAAGTLQRYIVVEVVVGAIALGMAALAATLLVRRSLRPLDRVASTASRVSRLPLDRGEVEIAERVPLADTDPRSEVGQVGAALNQMLGHVESSLVARQASETKVRQFVADASHELRTPLASIRGYSELVLRRGELAPDAEHAISRVASEGKRMQALVEDLLLLARLDAGRELQQREVDLVAIAADAVSDAHAAGRDHVWGLDVPEHQLPVLVGDESRLRQVLVNLLANARVHTPAGTRVVTSVRAVEGGLDLSVLDDGPGIAPELIPTLFDRFSRGDASRTRDSNAESSHPSTGLGLAIVDAIVRAHHGTIDVVSRPGATRITVHLPTAPPEPPERATISG